MATTSRITQPVSFVFVYKGTVLPCCIDGSTVGDFWMLADSDIISYRRRGYKDERIGSGRVRRLDEMERRIRDIKVWGTQAMNELIKDFRVSTVHRLLIEWASSICVLLLLGIIKNDGNNGIREYSSAVLNKHLLGEYKGTQTTTTTTRVAALNESLVLASDSLRNKNKNKRKKKRRFVIKNEK